MSALDELATYLGHPDRLFDARALELVSQAVKERNEGLPPAGHMGDDLDLPFAAAAAGSTIELRDAVLTGGMSVSATAVPVPGVGTCPGLVYRFSRYDGHILRPVVLILDDGQMAKVPTLTADATRAARAAAA